MMMPLSFLNYFSRDHARVPVQWDTKAHAGFTTGTPWLPVNENYVEINAEQAVNDEDSIYHHYRQLIQLRQGEEYGDVVVYGNHTLLDPQDSEVYAYIRSSGEKSLLIIANFTDSTLERTYQYGVKQVVLNNYYDAPSSLHELVLKPYQAMIIDIE